MLANKLRHRIAIDRPASTRTLNGAVSENWVSVAENLPAAIAAPLERARDPGRRHRDGRHRVRFLVRYDLALTVTAAMRIRHEGYAYNITAEVIADPMLRRPLRGARIREGT